MRSELWRWPSQCPMYGTMVYKRPENRAADTGVYIDRSNPQPMFLMF
jgi:hypothetical protein